MTITKTDKPIISVCMLAYNHELYISKAIESILIQKTNFPFELIIGEDNSTDNTASIIKQYTENNPDIIKPRFNITNLGMSANFHKTLSECQGEFIAFLEGDDYWTDENKLQYQYDFLIKNPDVSMVSHRHRIYIENEDRFIDDTIEQLFQNNTVEGIYFDYDFTNRFWVTQPLTLMYRRDCLDLQLLSKHKHLRDIHLNFYLLKKGRGYCFNRVSGVFRRHIGGINSTRSDLYKAEVSYAILKEFNNLQNDDSIKKLYSYSIDNLIKENLKKSKRFFFKLQFYKLLHSKQTINNSLNDLIKLFIKSLINRL